MFRMSSCTLDALQCTENVVFIAKDTQILTVFNIIHFKIFIIDFSTFTVITSLVCFGRIVRSGWEPWGASVPS